MKLMPSSSRESTPWRMRTACLAALLAALAALAVACGGDGEAGSPEPASQPPAGTSTPLPGEPVPLAASAGLEGQEVALKDGVVSLDEYNAVVEATAGCMEAAGYVVTGFPGEGLRPLRFNYAVPGSDGAADGAKVQSAQEAFTACRRTNLDLVETARAQALAHPGAGVLEDLVTRIEHCMVNGGAPDQPDYAANGMVYYREIPRAVAVTSIEDAAAYRRCGLEAEAATGYPMPAPGCGPGLNAAELTACLTGAR